MAQDECGENDTPRARSWPDLRTANHRRTIAHRNTRKLSRTLREMVHKFGKFRGFCLYRSGSVCYVAKAGKNLIELREIPFLFC